MAGQTVEISQPPQHLSPRPPCQHGFHPRPLHSDPGPHASIRTKSLSGEIIVARRDRNRRIGDFLKELDLTEGRCTGIPTIRAAMAQNGSPLAQFSTDEERTHFLVELPVDPLLEGIAPSLLTMGAHDAPPTLTETESDILASLTRKHRSRTEIADQLSLSNRSGHMYKSIDRLRSLGLVEWTIPDKPQGTNQKMHITDRGRLRKRSSLRRPVICHFFRKLNPKINAGSWSAHSLGEHRLTAGQRIRYGVSSKLDDSRLSNDIIPSPKA